MCSFGVVRGSAQVVKQMYYLQLGCIELSHTMVNVIGRGADVTDNCLQGKKKNCLLPDHQVIEVWLQQYTRLFTHALNFQHKFTNFEVNSKYTKQQVLFFERQVTQ